MIKVQAFTNNLNHMSQQVTVRTSNGKYLYKVSESNGRFYCMKYIDSFFGSWSDIGKARGLEDALSIIKSHARKYGSIWEVYID